MRNELRSQSFHQIPRGVADRARGRRLSAEGQRLRVYDAARDHLARGGGDQATTVARRTLATWR